MNESNTGRLEVIKSDWRNEDCIGNNDVEWLIEQAERAIEKEDGF